MKRFYADDSAATSVKVGYRQASYKRKTPVSLSALKIALSANRGFFSSAFSAYSLRSFLCNRRYLLIHIRFSRHDSKDPATNVDTGEIDMLIGTDLVSSRRRAHMPNLIYVALYELMDGVLSLQNGAKGFQMEGSHSAFCVHFRSTRQGIVVTHAGRQYGPVSLAALIEAIERGLAEFLTDPLNKLPTGGAIEGDFLASWRALQQAMGQFR